MSIRILEHLFRHKLLMIAPIIIGGVFGILLMLATYQTHYESRATIWVERPSDFTGAGTSISDFNPYLAPAANQVNSMRELLASTSFLAAVSKRADGVDGGTARYVEIRQKTAIVQYLDHILYVVTSSSFDPTEAAKLNQAVIDEYSAVFAKEVKGQAGQASAFYKGQADLAKTAYDTATGDLNAYIRAHPQLTTTTAAPARAGTILVSDLDLSKLQIAQQTAEAQYDRAQAKYADSQIAATSADTSSAFFSVIDPPEVPTFAVVPRKTSLAVKPISGALFGGMIAVALFLLSWRMDRKVRFITDLAFVDNMVVVALPALRLSRKRWPASFVRIAAAVHGGIRDLSSNRADADGVGAEGAP